MRKSLGITLLICLAATPARAVKIADVTRIEGQFENTLSGVGLIVGLQGTGDGGEYAPAIRSLAGMLATYKNGDAQLNELADVKNVALVGLSVKGVAFAGCAALIATYEGLRPEAQGGPDPFRAVLRSITAILFLNFTWFNLVYLAGNPFGPNVVTSAG